MLENTGKYRIGLSFAVILVMAMTLQSVVVLFLWLRTSIQEDVDWAKRNLQEYALELSEGTTLTDEGEVAGDLQKKLTDSHAFSCMSLEQAGMEEPGDIACRFSETMQILREQAKKQRNPVVGFSGRGWYSVFSMGEVALLAVPLVNPEGRVTGSIAAERSLLPLYSSYRQHLRIVVCYLVVNALLFGLLFLSRVSHHFFRPLDKLVQKAEIYQPADQHFLLVSDDESPFRKLSTRLNTLFERIEDDNRALRRNIAELEKVNRELQKTNDLVLRSEKLASVGRLSAGLAHEIGNPLSIVQGYIELLSREDLSADEKRQFSAKALQELDRIKRLIRQLLDFSGQRNACTESVAVHALITDVVGFVSMEKSCCGCAISTRFMAEDDTLVADQDALRQVLINCLLNAVDATASLNDLERKISIATLNEQGNSDDSLLVLRIQDNGSGIAEDQLKFVFDPFYTTKGVGRGTGLGLFVSNTIVEGLGGSITLNNLDPAGVEVAISFPQQRELK